MSFTQLIMEIRNEFEQSMIDQGYKVFKHNHKNAIRGFQKDIIDDKGIRYYITVYHYNHKEQLQLESVPSGDTYTANAQFNLDKATTNIEYWGENDLNKIEDFFYKCWVALMPDYYELKQY